MWATLAFAAALGLAPDQAGALQLTNARATYGFLGAPRPDNKLLPGDMYFITFDIENLNVKNGKALYKMSMEFLNAKMKTEFKKDPEDMESTVSLGGNRLPAFASSEIGTETAPGEYTLKVEVTDRVANKSETLVRKFEVLPKAFGLVRLHMMYAQGPVPAPPHAVVGQSFFVNSAAVHFLRDKDSKQPNVVVEMNILDDKGAPTLAQPQKVEFNKDIDQKLIGLPVNLLVECNRPGKFTIELQATDRLANKTTKVSLPLQVVEVK
jgi:hypothetical protein